MKATLFAVFVALLLAGCGEEGDIQGTTDNSAPPNHPDEVNQEAEAWKSDLGIDIKLPWKAPDGFSEVFKIKKKDPSTLVFHLKSLPLTKAQYDPKPVLYRKMWKDRKIQDVRSSSLLKGLFERGATLEYVIYDKAGVHLFSFYLHKEDIKILPPVARNGEQKYREGYNRGFQDGSQNTQPGLEVPFWLTKPPTKETLEEIRNYNSPAISYDSD